VGLRALGYIEGKNLVIEFRWAETVEQLQEAAAELVRMNVEVIFAISSTETERARQATNTIPIVFATHADPIGLGHVASLPRPGGNITGLTVVQTEFTEKDMEILKETVPHATRFGVLWTPTAPSGRPTLQAAEAAGEKLGVQVEGVSVLTVADFAGAFATMARDRVEAVLVHGSTLTSRHNRPLLAELAEAPVSDHVQSGKRRVWWPDELFAQPKRPDATLRPHRQDSRVKPADLRSSRLPSTSSSSTSRPPKRST
jgi:putative ABC transport system substrate-binding protein